MSEAANDIVTDIDQRLFITDKNLNKTSQRTYKGKQATRKLWRDDLMKKG